MPEAYIVSAVRTPVGRRGGSLSRAHPADLAGHVLKAAVERSGVTADLVEDAEIVDESDGVDHAEVGGSAADATSETAPPLVAPVLAAPTDPTDDLIPRRSY